jgi:16S rRNA (guanine527-N7)-methyltransferase
MSAGARPEAGAGPVAAAPLGPEGFAEVAKVPRGTLAALATYDSLLRRTQRAVNLVGAATLGDVWRRHFLDSAQLLPLLPAPAGRACVVLDVGSGAGFPGLVLAILSATVPGAPALEVHLVEANARKCGFLREAARRTGIRVVLHGGRVEDLAPFAVDAIVARAVAPVARILGLAAGFLELPGARPMVLLLKGRRAPQELTEARKHWKMRAESVPSITDPSGIVLRLKDIARA